MGIRLSDYINDENKKLTLEQIRRILSKIKERD